MEGFMFKIGDIIKFKYDDNKYNKITATETPQGKKPHYLLMEVAKQKDGKFRKIDNIATAWDKETCESTFSKVEK